MSAASDGSPLSHGAALARVLRDLHSRWRSVPTWQPLTADDGWGVEVARYGKPSASVPCQGP